ncbi:hypothetical protein R3P38DRAFT_2954555 [Favolaschia claudopus]|uniref:DUF6593 domain-containing protein n=1 Tax=Favolaschia claudopus TaxID=2862362 RepID=A0AAW0BDD2_9AGAR
MESEPLVLTWPDPNQLEEIPSHDPPAYDHARVPLHPVNYQFSPQGFNTLLLLPPSGFPDSRPQYHISVSMNCFNPFSFITTVHKGASDLSPHVGEFEMGISTIPGTVVMGQRQKAIKDVVRTASSGRARWSWRFSDDSSRHLRWELVNFGTGIFNCFLASEPYPASIDLKIAQFKGAPSTQKGTDRTPPSMLRIYPQGQPLFDDILMSILIIERRRLQPPTPKEDTLWWSA